MTEQDQPKLTPEERAAVIVDKAEEIFNASQPPEDDPLDDDKSVTVVDLKPMRWADKSAGGKPLATMVNAMLCIAGLRLECRHDIFRNRYTVNGSSLQTFVGDLSDAISRKIREQSRARFGLDPGKECTSDALKRMCEERRFHPFQDYLLGLKWDGVARLEEWLTKYLGVKNNDLTRAQAAIIIAAIVRRAFEPGCKFDHVPVLEGPEGARKSSVCRILANGTVTGNDFFSDSPILHVDERKQQELSMGVVVYELAELAGLRKGDQHIVKNFITKQVERARPAYAEFNVEQERSPLFVGTFNTDANTGEIVEYLNMGDRRRWWPLRTADKIDTAGLMAVRDQLFAEAMVEYQMFGGRDLFLSDKLEEQAKAIAKTREKPDPLADTLSTIYHDVLRMKSEPAVGSTMLTTDSKPVLRLEDGASVKLIKGEEALPFAMYHCDSGDVWVSAKYVGELVPAGRKNDGGTSMGLAMRSLGWVSVNDRRSGDKVRGWAYLLSDIL